MPAKNTLIIKKSKWFHILVPFNNRFFLFKPVTTFLKSFRLCIFHLTTKLLLCFSWYIRLSKVIDNISIDVSIKIELLHNLFRDLINPYSHGSSDGAFFYAHINGKIIQVSVSENQGCSCVSYYKAYDAKI